MLPHPITDFEAQRYYKNESNINGVYWRNNLSKMEEISYTINLDE